MSAPAPAGGPAPDGGNQPPPNMTSNRRLQQTQAQVDEVVDIMRVNVDKVLERDQKLSELDDRAGESTWTAHWKKGEKTYNQPHPFKQPKQKTKCT